MGKPRLDQQTRQAARFAALIRELETEGMSQSEFARRTGIETSYINKIRNGERKGVGADMIQRVRDKLRIDGRNISTDYFFDDREPPSYRVYLLDEKRAEKKIGVLEQQVQTLVAKVEELERRSPAIEPSRMKKLRR